MSGCHLESLPAEVAPHAGRLTQLKLSNNPLASLPDWLGSFAELATLVLDRCQLLDLPTVITHLPRLSILMASHNVISKLQPNMIVGLSSLKVG